MNMKVIVAILLSCVEKWYIPSFFSEGADLGGGIFGIDLQFSWQNSLISIEMWWSEWVRVLGHKSHFILFAEFLLVNGKYLYFQNEYNMIIMI